MRMNPDFDLIADFACALFTGAIADRIAHVESDQISEIFCSYELSTRIATSL
jgi:hypothetical protein